MWYSNKKEQIERALFNKEIVLNHLLYYAYDHKLSIKREHRRKNIKWDIDLFNLNLEKINNKIILERLTANTELYLLKNIIGHKNIYIEK